MLEMSFEKLQNNVEICITKDHKFGTDAFLLADFAKPRHKDMVCDLGTGCGIIPILMQIKFDPCKLFCVDIQQQAIDQLKITIDRNHLEKIIPVHSDLKQLWNDSPNGRLDLVTCNPPYKAANAGIESCTDAQKIARHEIMCSINDVCKAASKLLKFGGRLCICNRPERLADVITAMKDNGIEPKLVRFVSKTPNDAPWLFLIEGKKGSKPFMKVMPQLFINGNKGFSEELLSIYGGNKE